MFRYIAIQTLYTDIHRLNLGTEPMHYLFLILVMFLNPIASHASSTKTIKLAYSDIESFPFQMGNGTSVAEPPGLSIDILEHAANTLNVNIEYIRLPGKRVLHHMRANQVDGGFIFSYNQKRAQYANYPIKDEQVDSTLRIATLDYFFYKLKEQEVKWDGTKLESVGNRPVGAHNGFSIINILKKNEINTLEMESTEQLFTMLKKRRIAAVAIQSNIADSYINENELPNIEKITPPISTKYYYLIFSHKFTKENPELVQAMWKAVGKVRDEIIARNMKMYLSDSN